MDINADSTDSVADGPLYDPENKWGDRFGFNTER